MAILRLLKPICTFHEFVTRILISAIPFVEMLSKRKNGDRHLLPKKSEPVHGRLRTWRTGTACGEQAHSPILPEWCHMIILRNFASNWQHILECASRQNGQNWSKWHSHEISQPDRVASGFEEWPRVFFCHGVAFKFCCPNKALDASGLWSLLNRTGHIGVYIPWSSVYPAVWLVDN